MPSRLETEIKSTAGSRYLFFDPDHDELVRGMKPDTPEYFTWLAGLKSFHFSSKDGHFTARSGNLAQCSTEFERGLPLRL